jgi:serine phosphatase RsbU (regulator of sigma subunit)/putative methionine-R-sulfoxide reductase with GAF domain
VTGPKGNMPVLIYGLLVGVTGLGLLVYQLATVPPPLPWLPILLFAVLSFLVQRASFHLGSSVVHSLAGVIDISAVLALGPTAGALVAALSGVAYLELNAVRHNRLGRRDLVEIPLFNAGLKALMALTAGALYLGLNGEIPVLSLDRRSALAVGAVCLAWFVIDHLCWAIWDLLDGGLEHLRALVRESFVRTLMIELLPLPFSVVVALAYARLDWIAFGILSLVIVIVALLAQHWAETRNELVQRVSELTTIEEVGRTIAQAQLDVDEICELMYEWTSQIADASIFHLGLFEGEEYSIRLWVRNGERVPSQTFTLTPGVGLVNWLRDSKQPLMVRDFEKEEDSLPARPAYVSDNPPRSALFVPLIAGETVIGTVSIQSFRRSAYRDSDERVLSAMANQAALAIQKARLFAQEHKRARQLETIGQVSRQITATLELPSLFKRIVQLVRENFGYYHVAIYSVDRERRAVTFRASSSAVEQDIGPAVAWEQGLVGWVAAHGEPVTVNNVDADTRYRCVDALEETRSELTVPVLLEDGLVAVLDVQSDQVDAFSSDDLFILETLGSQIAVAIQEARLYEAEQQQAWLSTALLQVADAMSQVSDLDAVLTSVVRLTSILAGVDRCSILLWEADTETFVPAQTYGLAPELRDAFEQSEFTPGLLPALDLVRLDKRPLLVSAASDDGLIPQPLAEMYGIREMAVLPLLAQGELLGAMLVDYAGRARQFSERLINMLSGIANQAALVIQSARLVQAQREEAYVSMALLQVAEAVGRSTDLDETLATVVRITPILVGVETCAILLWDEGGEALTLFQQYGLGRDERSALSQLRIPRDSPLVRKLESGQAFVVLEGGEESREIVSVLKRDALMAFPLMSKGDMLGCMVVDYAGPEHRSTERLMTILSGIAGQAAIAVENARLLREAAEQERMRQELEVAKRIQTSFLPECCPPVPGWELAAYWRSAREVGGDFYDFIPMPVRPEDEGRAGRMGLVVADVADKGVPAALFMALSRTLLRTVSIDGRSPSAAIARTNDLIMADARSGLFVTMFYAILQPWSGEVAYVNAGHMPPLVVRAKEGMAEELRVPGMALGILPNESFGEYTSHLRRGDALILYTDGVTDAANAEQDRFGLDRLKELVRNHRHESAHELAETIKRVIEAFVGDTVQFDDFTLVVARREP